MMKRVKSKIKSTSSTKTKQLAAKRSKPIDKQLISAYREMLRARKVDEKAILLYKQNKAHFQIGCAGHEAVQVAAAHSLKPGYDWAYPYYRDMAFCAAWGMSTREFLLNILNKADDPNSGGRQMPMHYGHKDLNIPSQSSPTGTQFLQAVGAALAIRYREEDKVVYVSSGEGTTSQGTYHEALNWAARDLLPVIFLIQDNNYAISVHISEQIAGKSVSKISTGYQGLDVVEVDGLDYQKSFSLLKKVVQRARSGKGPSVVVADVVRLQSHSISDNQTKYRSEKELKKERLKDPILRLEHYLLKEKILGPAQLEQIKNEIQQAIDRDAEWADQQANPVSESCSTHVYVNPTPWVNVIENPATGPEVFMVEALNHALDEEMGLNPNMVIYGQDVAHGKGGVFSVTQGLTAKYGVKRVFNSPLAEDSIAGTAVGMATLGIKPIIEIQFADFIWTAMTQIRDEIALIHYRSNAAFTCPVVLRVPTGGYIHGALYHSQSIEATFSHFPGLFVIYPSNATDAKGLLKSAIRCPDPVLFLEHKGLYRQIYAKGPEGDINALVPIGKAKIVRPGTDATILCWGALVQKSLLAAETLTKEGYQSEVIDLRTLVPLDQETILNSVKKTGRVLIAHEDTLFMGFGAELAAIIAAEAFPYLDAPVKRIARKNTEVAHSAILEEAILPQTSDVERELRLLLRY